MSEHFRSVPTRFRAYQLGQPGSSFSYFADGHFTLIEAMATDMNRPRILEELVLCNKKTIDRLHITSWDQDHCFEGGLDWVLAKLAPAKIEYPGYPPHTENGKACLSTILAYEKHWRAKGCGVRAQCINPPYISSLRSATDFEYRDIYYHPKRLLDKSNDNSTAALFRRGCFNVLSLGDLENPDISSMLRRDKVLKRETDVMILAHHGADNGFTTKRFIEALQPRVAICSSDYDNKFDHPRDGIRNLLREGGVDLFTTKTGDVLIESLNTHRVSYRVINLCADSAKIRSVKEYRPRKADYLAMNLDSLRNVHNPGFKGLKRR